jgi:hypothetical protein
MLHAAFAAHGTIKSITLPRKDDKSLKGFAFVEYADETDATTAIAKCVQRSASCRLGLSWRVCTDRVDRWSGKQAHIGAAP